MNTNELVSHDLWLKHIRSDFSRNQIQLTQTCYQKQILVSPLYYSELLKALSRAADWSVQ